MNKSQVLAVFPKFLLFSFLLIASFLPVVSLSAQETQVEISNISGNVEVLMLDVDDYIPAQEGMKLEASDQIRVPAGGSAELSFNEANTNVVRLQEAAQATILLDGDEKIELTKGEAFTSIGDLPADTAFEIRTPTAVTGARGTDWVTKVTDEGTDVEAVEDNPYVKEILSDGKKASEATFVWKGHATRVKPFQKPEPLKPLSQDRLAHWQDVKRDVRQRADEAFVRRNTRPEFNRGQFMKDLRQRRPEIFRGNVSGPAGEMKPLVSGEKGAGKRPGDFPETGAPLRSDDRDQKFRQQAPVPGDPKDRISDPGFKRPREEGGVQPEMRKERDLRLNRPPEDMLENRNVAPGNAKKDFFKQPPVGPEVRPQDQKNDSRAPLAQRPSAPAGAQAGSMQRKCVVPPRNPIKR